MARRIITCTKIPEPDRDTIHQLPLDSYGDIHPGPVGTQVSYGVDLDDEQFEWLLSQGPSNLIHAITVGDRGMGWTPSTIPAEYQLRDFIGDPETGIARAMEGEGETTETVDESTRTYRYWRPGPILDQGSEGACHLKGTLIRMADGSHKPIEDVGLMERVVTAEGNTGRVLQKMARDHGAGLTNVKLRGHRHLRMTPEHPVLTRRGYVAAGELEPGDEVALTRYQPGETIELDVTGWLQKGDYGRRTNVGILAQGGVLTEVSAPPATIPLSVEFGRLVGLYLAEGHTTENKVMWTFNAAEEDTLVAEVQKLCRSVLGAETRLQYRPTNSINVVLYGKLWRVLFERLFGTGAGDKGLPGVLASGPAFLRLAVLGGWLSGDGYRRRSSVSGITVSKRLALDMYALAQDHGLYPTIRASAPSVNRHARTRRERWEVEIPEGEGPRPDSDERAVWRKVVEAVYEPFAGIVYNLHVEGDESYVAEGMGVHNCVGFSAAAFKGCDPLMSSVDDSEALRIYRRAQHLDQWPGECVDEQTQCLSRRGWLGPEELQAGDEILTFDMDGEGLRWKPVKLVHRYFSKPYRVWENNQLSIAVTDNHKWVVANRNTHGAYELVETLDLKSQHTVPRAVPSLLEQPTKPTYSDDFIRALAWVVMEGYYRAEYRRGNGIGISQKSHKAGVAAVMERLGVARGYEDKIGVHHWELSGELATQIREIAPGKAPGIDWLRTLTRRQLRIFVDTCIQADGSQIDAGRNGRRERRVFHQKPGPILDAFLAACSMLGIAVSRSTESSEDRAAETWSLRDSSHAEVRKLTPGPYLQGPVWCPETEAGTFVARRNGSVFITGNSYSGTSVDAGCKVLREDETIEVYAWATTKAELYYWILNKGPVMLGMDWYEGMYVTDRNGFIRPTGRRVGGHAILARGRSAWKSLRLQNSWGRDFGESGYCWLSEVDLSFLMSTRVDMATSVQVRL